MSKAEEKPATRAAIKRSGLTYSALGEALGKDKRYVSRAVFLQLPIEEAGRFVRVSLTVLVLLVTTPA